MEVFDDTFIPPGLTEVRAQHCPRCVWPYVHPVQSLDQTHWLCASCGHCWHLVHGRLRPVDPLTCHGCTARDRRDCVTLLQSEFPHFSAGTADYDELTNT